jgi:hypothetical protein
MTLKFDATALFVGKLDWPANKSPTGEELLILQNVIQREIKRRLPHDDQLDCRQVLITNIKEVP